MPDYSVDESGFIIGKVPSRTGHSTGSPRGVLPECPVCHCLVKKLAKHVRTQHPSYEAPIGGSQPNDHTQIKAASNQPRRTTEIKVVVRKRARMTETATPPASKVMTHCPHCHCPIRSDRLQRHITERCPARARPPIAGEKETPQAAKPKERHDNAGSASPASERAGTDSEALRQSDHESIYGGKYLGHVRREWDGKFGSLPLYDDYGDESDAE